MVNLVSTDSEGHVNQSAEAATCQLGIRDGAPEVSTCSFSISPEMPDVRPFRHFGRWRRSRMQSMVSADSLRWAWFCLEFGKVDLRVFLGLCLKVTSYDLVT